MPPPEHTSDADLLTQEQAARVLTVAPATLQDWRVRSYGPPVTRIGRLVRYRRAALLAWIAENTSRPEEGVAR